jgi:acyl carrier protein|tara:strand:+ start:148 stop:396 length:249 start_codon:yes stop_codon:yes gene_type:complete
MPINTNELDVKLEEIFLRVFEIDEINLDSSVDDLPEWDSFGHFEIIMAIEKEFNIKLELSDFSKMTSIPKIKNKILEYLDEQ